MDPAVAPTTNGLRPAQFLPAHVELPAGDPPGINTPLIGAVSSGHPRMVSLLLEHGASPEARDRALRASALSWAVLSRPANFAQTQQASNPALYHAACYGDREAVELLLSLGAGRDPVNQRNQTPGDLARSRRHPEIAALLPAATPP